MSNFIPSKYQSKIYSCIEDNNIRNIMIDAKAGSGKTTTLIEISKKLVAQNKKALFLSFNKSIVNELNEKIQDPNILIKTVHSLGLTFLKSFFYRKFNTNYELQISDKRNDDIIKFYFDQICYESFYNNNEKLNKDDFKELYNSIIAKLSFYIDYFRLINLNYHDYNKVIDTCMKEDFLFNDYVNLGITDFPKVIENSIDKIKYNFENPIRTESGNNIILINFTDMIYFPVLYNMSIPYSIKDKLDYVLVDECQDLSILQQKFIKQLDTNNNRFILVGDKKQCIYKFAGSDTESVQKLQYEFNTTNLPLSICYRCPENVIKIAQTIVPDIQWNNAREDKGIVEFIKQEDLLNLIDENSMIIARLNSDLLKLYKYLVLDKKKCIKFKNIELVNKTIKDIKTCIKSYIRYYNNDLNVEVALNEAIKSNPNINTSLKKKELIKLKSQDNTKIKNISKYTIDYVLICMNEYYEQGDYKFADSTNIMREYFNIIKSLIDNYKEQYSSIYLNDFIDYLESFLKGNINKNVCVLSTVHMAKGAEAEKVFIMDYPVFPYEFKNQNDDDKEQEKNLQYVAITRAKKALYLCLCENPENEDRIDVLNKNAKFEINKILNT